MAEIKNLLPIGSVVLLQDAQKPLMAFGVRQTNNATGEEFDYIGVVYPEGNIGSESGQFLFNHADIAKILFTGYETEERKEFLERLDDFYKR